MYIPGVETKQAQEVRVCFGEKENKRKDSQRRFLSQTGAGRGSPERSWVQGERGGVNMWMMGRGAVESTITVVKGSHSSALPSDSVWLGVTSGNCLMSQAGGHMTAQSEGQVVTEHSTHTFIKTCSLQRYTE